MLNPADRIFGSTSGAVSAICWSERMLDTANLFLHNIPIYATDEPPFSMAKDLVTNKRQHFNRFPRLSRPPEVFAQLQPSLLFGVLICVFPHPSWVVPEVFTEFALPSAYRMEGTHQAARQCGCMWLLSRDSLPETSSWSSWQIAKLISLPTGLGDLSTETN